MADERYRHIFLKDSPSIKNFTSVPSLGAALRIPQRDRRPHSEYLTQKFNQSWQDAENEQAVVHSAREGVYIEFKSDPGADLVTKSLEDLRSKKVRLLNVRTEKEDDQEVTYATVYVAHDKKNHFLNKIQQYAEENTQTGKPKNETLINSIADIRKALLVESFWQDKKDLIPTEEKSWCEVWLSSDQEDVVQRFEGLLAEQEIESAAGLIKFPERSVKVIFANKEQLEKLTSLSDDIAEYRRAKETAAFWLEMDNKEQAEWVEELLKRSRVDHDSNVAVCILDTGVNHGHPLLSNILKDEDCQTVVEEWGVDDHKGHGTLMAGVVGYGDLKKCLESKDIVHIKHCLESVKILPKPPAHNKQELWGYITAQAVSRAEIQAPHRKRIVCLAVTAKDTIDRGRPSSWSGQVDQLSSGVENDNKKLIIVCAGNITDKVVASNYPDAQLTDSIHDPAQAWNVLTLGAYTELDILTNKTLQGFNPVAKKGELSPFSTTSCDWEGKWPNKPEIVMEGGNLATDGKGFRDEPDDLCVLSTYRDPATRHFYGFNMTSAATAQAAWFASQIQSSYHDIWPETIRALMVHSAEWTDALKRQFLANPDNPSKTDCARMLRICGYGVPDLGRALYSGSNNLTLIAQEEIQPFDKKDEGSGYKTKEMHLYELPWPKEVLMALPPEVNLQMRVTLSYFVEPGPGEIGWKDRYRYASHALRFDVKSPRESTDEFLKRINAAVRSEEEGHPGTQSASEHWLIGSNGRDKGSIHSDIWKGTSAELAESGVMAIYPVIGWWRERAYLNKWNKQSRYSLVVSITTPEEEIDIYTPVANQIGIMTPVSIAT
ncbi:MAG: S8 family peptidase [Candidatus Omnitrophica bacterium]|nr:S8 family peptidase [Candidatus Omnitrophota bacterium]